MNEQTAQPTTSGNSNLLDLTSNIVVAFVANSHVHVNKDDVSDLIKQTHATLVSLMEAPKIEEAAPAKQEPAVSIRASVKPDYLVCLEDGAKVKMLKRYLKTNFDLTPEQYRSKWGLPSDYPMVAPNYAEKRRQLAKSIGLGTRGRTARKSTSETTTPEARRKSDNEAAAPKRRSGRKSNEAKRAEAAAA